MVGIVIVSHSAKLADGVVELAREMGGDDVGIVAAGGMAADPGAVGTDATLVMQAVMQADSGDGVLVLMDLGSALLSAEMAVEMLGDDVSGPVLLCDAPLVEGAVAAAAAAKIGASLDEVAAEARGGARAKSVHLGAADNDVPSRPEESGDGEALEVRIEVRNRLGLHARPAARFVQTAGRFDADITVTNETTGKGPESARSLNGVAILGARRGHKIVVRARGPDSDAALAALRELAEDNFGDTDELEADGIVPAAVAPGRDAAGAGPGELRGFAASPGVVVGPARPLRAVRPEIPDTPGGEPAGEWAALEAALARARAEIERSRTAATVRAGADRGSIFDAHLLFLEDDALLGPARHAVFDEGMNAARAWDGAVRAMASAYGELEDEYQRARAADVIEVGRQVLEHLVGAGASPEPAVGAGILVAADLAARDAARLDPAVTVGIATAAGGPTSHAAILARGLGIPAVVALGPRVLEIDDGTPLALDGGTGTVLIEPAGDVVAEYSERARRTAAEGEAARRAAEGPAITRDGVHVEVYANIGSVADAGVAAAAGADGIGLLRTEFLFMDRTEPPDEDEQAAAYAAIAEAMGGRPVIVRTLDVGGDKPLDYIPAADEANPFLGVRGIRLALVRKDLFTAQMRAIVRAAAAHPIKVMFPMVSSPAEWRDAVRILEEQRSALARAGHPVPERVDAGIMVEVPAAGLLADEFAKEVSFFSVGTNDLSQYVFAAERGNPSVAHLADATQPALLRMIRMVTDAAAPHKIPVGVCGELAGDVAAVPLLVGLGVTELSVAPPAVAAVKQAVRLLDMNAATEAADRAMRGLPAR
ncbi:MAG: phosphoenolpyruvate--protein phosphotransferase [Actinomycetota bacterium]